MNSFEILYQVYRARYSLSRVQESLDKGYKLGLVGTADSPERMRAYLGEARKPLIEGPQPASERSEPLVSVSYPYQPEDKQRLDGCEAALVHLGRDKPALDTIREIADFIPLKVPCLWVVESLDPLDLKPDAFTPRMFRIDPLDPGPPLCSLLISAFPEVSLGVARDYSQVRFQYARKLVRRSAVRNSFLALASSVQIPPIPGLSWMWGFLATTGETLAITASQLRLCLLMAALHGRPLDFFDRVGELWPIVGSAFGWRSLARELIGLVPVAGWAAKAAIAYTGTWMVGEGSRLYYEYGQPTEAEVLREIVRRSRALALEAVQEQLLGGKTSLDLEDTPGEDPVSDEALLGKGEETPPEP